MGRGKGGSTSHGKRTPGGISTTSKMAKIRESEPEDNIETGGLSEPVAEKRKKIAGQLANFQADLDARAEREQSIERGDAIVQEHKRERAEKMQAAHEASRKEHKSELLKAGIPGVAENFDAIADEAELAASATNAVVGKPVDNVWTESNGYEKLETDQSKVLKGIAGARKAAGMKPVKVSKELKELFKGQPITERLYHLVYQGDLSEEERGQAMARAIGAQEIKNLIESDYKPGSGKFVSYANDIGLDLTQDPKQVVGEYAQRFGQDKYEDWASYLRDHTPAFGEPSVQKRIPGKTAYKNFRGDTLYTAEDLTANLNNPERAALYAYTTPFYTTINNLFKSLANSNPEIMSPTGSNKVAKEGLQEVYDSSWRKDIGVFAQTLIEAMAKMPKQKTTVDRVVYVSDPSFAEGGVDFFYPGVSSTNDSQAMPVQLASLDAAGVLYDMPLDKLTKVSMLLTSDNGVAVGYLGANAYTDFHDEIITPPGTIYHIDGSVDVGDKETWQKNSGVKPKRWIKAWGRQRSEKGELVDAGARRKPESEVEEYKEREQTPKEWEQEIDKRMDAKVRKAADYVYGEKVDKNKKTDKIKTKKGAAK